MCIQKAQNILFYFSQNDHYKEELKHGVNNDLQSKFDNIIEKERSRITNQFEQLVASLRVSFRFLRYIKYITTTSSPYRNPLVFVRSSKFFPIGKRGTYRIPLVFSGKFSEGGSVMISPCIFINYERGHPKSLEKIPMVCTICA